MEEIVYLWVMAEPKMMVIWNSNRCRTFVILPWIQLCDLTVHIVYIWRSFGFWEMGLILVLLDFHFMCNCSLKLSRWWMLYMHMIFFVFCKPELITTIILKLSTVFVKRYKISCRSPGQSYQLTFRWLLFLCLRVNTLF